ncbi:hypothetical protein Vretimale_4874 [Volvox reticuliferus]|uniref:Uncharacterized protein n=1 Tax=Volvox reticuliferus TaxID=1737510 RepID=A0A8J4G4I4_9CHLO|nr:hypothetical protein Vretifemale_3500 [Volvox reticuliferus]GIL99738.1 hypothetical protein Vretimale_4874 [Volvox reticuliferus]
MSKRRSNEGRSCEMFLPAKRLAIDACTTAFGSGSTHLLVSQPSEEVAGLGQNSTTTLPHDNTLEVWLAVAAQVQDALAALPGWIQIAHAVQFDHQEHLSSLSSASTPLPVRRNGTVDSGSWPLQLGALRPDASELSGPGSQQHGGSPEVPAAASTPGTAITRAAAAIVTGAVAADLPAQPASAAPLDSCTSDSDTAAACGWFSKCRGCCQLTAGEVELQGQVVPLCRGCSSSLHRRPSGEREHAVNRIMRAHAALCQREAAGAF